MLKIGACVGCVKRNSSDTAKVKRSEGQGHKVKWNCAQNIKCMPQTSSDSGNIPVL